MSEAVLVVRQNRLYRIVDATLDDRSNNPVIGIVDDQWTGVFNSIGIFFWKEV